MLWVNPFQQEFFEPLIEMIHLYIVILSTKVQGFLLLVILPFKYIII